MTRPPSIPSELWDQIPAALRPAIAAVVGGLEARVAQLEARVAELEAKLTQNSSNSSKPPSSDRPQVKPGPPKPPSGKRRGGQPGHPKHERFLLPPDQVFEHKPTGCRRCDTPLRGDDPSPHLDQVLDLPARLRHVVHHRRHTLACRCCGTRTTAAPVPQAASGFAPKLTATVAYLSGVGRLSKRTIRTLLDDLCGLPVSLGAVSQLEGAVSRALAPIHTAAHEHAKGLDANVDETGWKQGNSKAWLWVAVTTLLTVFLIRPNRNRAAFDALAGPTPGVLTTDRFGVYTHLTGDRRQVCWAHLRRDFQAMIDRRNGGSEIGEELLFHADILFTHWQRVRDGTRSWGGGVAVDVRRSGRGGADEQRGRAGGATCGVLAEDELRDGQRAGQPVRRADAHRGGVLPPTESQHPRLPRAGRHRAESITVAPRGVNGYAVGVDFYHVRVADGGHRLGLGEEADERLRVGLLAGPHQLEGDRAVQPGLPGEVHRPHAADAELPLDAEPRRRFDRREDGDGFGRAGGGQVVGRQIPGGGGQVADGLERLGHGVDCTARAVVTVW